MKAGTAVSAMVGVLASGSAMAEPTFYGHGARSCGSFVAAAEATRHGANETYPYMVWISGFFSSMSAETGFSYPKGSDTQSFELWLENYCRAKPLSMFGEAVLGLLLELPPKQP